MITQRALLILFLIKEPKWDVWRLIQQLNQADFPSNLGKSLKVLLAEDLIIPNKLYNGNGAPIDYKLCDKGEHYLKDNFDSTKTLEHIALMNEPDFLYSIVEKWIAKSDFI